MLNNLKYCLGPCHLANNKLVQLPENLTSAIKAGPVAVPAGRRGSKLWQNLIPLGSLFPTPAPESRPRTSTNIFYFPPGAAGRSVDNSHVTEIRARVRVARHEPGLIFAGIKGYFFDFLRRRRRGSRAQNSDGGKLGAKISSLGVGPGARWIRNYLRRTVKRTADARNETDFTLVFNEFSFIYKNPQCTRHVSRKCVNY